MHLPLGTFSPEVRLAIVSASRNCFPRGLSEKRTKALVEACRKAGIDAFTPEGECAIVESKEHAEQAAAQVLAAGCDAAVLFLGNFSPEIEDACFVKAFGKEVMIISAAEESALSLIDDRGDALCGMLSAVLAVDKRRLMGKVHIPESPVVDTAAGALAVADFETIMKVVKGIRGSTIGLFGPRPRDFETCNYNVASTLSIGVEIEELALHDLVNEVKRIRAEEDTSATLEAMQADIHNMPSDEFGERLAAYQMAVSNFREQLRLSGMTTQCWSEQELSLGHVPCFINGRMTARGFPISCENDVYSLVAELMGQYASDADVTNLDVNHSIPNDLHTSIKDYPAGDVVGLFHCGNTEPGRLKNPKMHHQVIMKRMMEPDADPDITRGNIEGQIAASPLTMLQVHGVGDKLRAYFAEGEFLDLDPKTFGGTGTAYIPGLRRFYRHVLLGRFHHHAAVAFGHCGAALLDACKLLGIDEVYYPLPDGVPYPGENVFESGLTARPIG